MAKNRHPEREPGVRRRGYTIVIALAFFVCLGGLPAILSALHLKINAAPPTFSDGIKLLGAPQALQAVPLPPVARPSAFQATKSSLSAQTMRSSVWPGLASSGGGFCHSCA